LAIVAAPASLALQDEAKQLPRDEHASIGTAKSARHCGIAISTLSSETPAPRGSHGQQSPSRDFDPRHLPVRGDRLE